MSSIPHPCALEQHQSAYRSYPSTTITIVCHGRGRFQTQLDPQEIRELRQEPGTTVWLDLTNPSAAELQLLRDEFDFHPLAIEAATRQHERPNMDSYGAYYFVVFSCLEFNAATNWLTSAPIYLFIGRNYLVTVHDEPIAQLGETLQHWQAQDSPRGQDVGSLTYALLDAIVDDYFLAVDQVAERIAEVEDIFGRFETTALESIFVLKKDLLQMRRVVLRSVMC